MPSNASVISRENSPETLRFQVSLLRLNCQLSAETKNAPDEKLSRQVEELAAYVR